MGEQNAPDQGTTGWPVRLEHPVVKRVLKTRPGSEEASPASFGNAKEKAQAKSDGKRVVADKGMADDAHKQAKRDGKRTAAGDSVTDGANKQAPPKRAKAPRHSSVRALVVENQQQRGAVAGCKAEDFDLDALNALLLSHFMTPLHLEPRTSPPRQGTLTSPHPSPKTSHLP
ncbi:hypothetical protein Bca52824_026806 [Brassica carinata]|uniref:Uncharacterized protein n=1 Tax=Brassica carinata TaxID=52824 RepID=A0A8X7SH71_BRACI|nr:hypothetical protein Bca52824_026806 [Brassica carinata]